MPNDELDVRRYLMSFSNNINLRKGINLQSMLYGYTTTRNWRRQGYSYNSYTATNPNPPPSDWTGVVLGDESTDGGAIYLRDRTGNRNRQFEVIGWEQKILHNKSFGNFNNELIAGYRILYERAYEQRINGTNDQAKSGDLISDEIRTGNALSLFALNKFSISQKLDITPGVRVEFYSYEREILREANIDTNRVADNQIREVIPGFGVNYRPASKLNFFTGIHRGYAPPRIKDAIDFSAVNPVLELEAEKSWNLEVGLRSQPIKGMFLEVTWFYMDFENQIIPSSQSIGGPGFGVTNAGRTLHKGFETSFTLDSREFLTSNWKIQFDLSATTIKAIYNSDRLVSSGNDQVNVRGNRLPYAPEFTLSCGFSIEAPFGTGLRLTDNYIGNQFTDELNTVNASFNGRIGKIGSRNVLDATLYHIISSMNATINISIKNVTDERYIATRRPEGIRVGLPRYITAGFAIKF
jgi:Fe(3+) dicitrate transport protein